MNTKPKILSTKELTEQQRNMLEEANITVFEADFIKVKGIDFNCPREIENAIFTSKNSVKQISNRDIAIKNSYCVGDKTEAFLIAKGYPVTEKAYQAKGLATKIINNHKEKEFIFFCGDRRREELPALLSEHGVAFKEIEVYKTEADSKQLFEEFDGIMFFSPSAVQSFTLKNHIEEAVVFSLGKTTEAEVKKHTNNIITANKPTIENVIVQVIKHFNS
ncbi:uroporphyrinogen-III synthase [Zhouia amylolytica]|uniref:uroporphyrinogen-III synthase n=1 Tax=Zhouia amylolytica TaxID=376730 RepID=UPI0020CBE217|nr:uroporphyrinogen-III synthase [Zhouia amylolytica]MCQ0111487.1 uroporphyrinogen-III synthase [Zhouia amylolytica]